MLRRAGYPQERPAACWPRPASARILSPPTLGAAAFIIAEYLRVSYLEVLVYATIPTILYYLGIFLAIEIDARRFDTRAGRRRRASAVAAAARFGYHFSSLIVIVVLLAFGVGVPGRGVRHRTGVRCCPSWTGRTG